MCVAQLWTATVIIACRAATSRPTARPGITLLSMQLLAWPAMLGTMCRMILVALVPPQQSTRYGMLWHNIACYGMLWHDMV